MLQLNIKNLEFFDENIQEFVTINKNIVLEHSLLSISKWEAKWKKSYFLEEKKSPEEVLDYIRCMTITSNVDPIIYRCLNKKHIDTIQEYIKDPMTATTIRKNNQLNRRMRNMTSELIYCWMFSLNIPIECEKWHFNRLMTLIEVCSIENNPKRKKMSRREIYNQNAALNAARRAKYGTRG